MKLIPVTTSLFVLLGGSNTASAQEEDFYSLEPTILAVDNLPKEVDWVKFVRDQDTKAVIPMRQQGGCGACWAFTAVAAMEFYNWIAGGTFLEFSPQQLIDCDVDGLVDDGCNGGLSGSAFFYMRSNPIY